MEKDGKIIGQNVFVRAYIETIDNNELKNEIIEYIDNKFYIISDYTYFTYMVSDIESERISTDIPYITVNRIISELLKY